MQQFKHEIAGICIDKGKCYVEDCHTGEIAKQHSIESCRLIDFIVYEDAIFAAFNDGTLRVIQCSNGEVKSKRINGNIH